MAKVGEFATLRCKLSSFCVDAEVLHIGTIHCQSRVPWLRWVAQVYPKDIFFFFVVGTKGMKSNFLFWIHMGIPSPTESPSHKIGVPSHMPRILSSE
jgi:hypothetical protein